MKLLNFSLKSMKSRWLLFLFLYIQITLFVISTVNLYSMVFIKQINISSIKSTINPSKTLSINIDVAEMMQNGNKKLEEKTQFYNYITSNPNIDKLIRFNESVIQYESTDKDFNKVMQRASTSQSESDNLISIYSVSTDYMDFLSNYIDEGRVYDKEDKLNYENFIMDYIKNGSKMSSEPTLPVVAGYSFKKFYKINDIIEGYSFGKRLNIKYKIIGFLKKNTTVLTSNFSYYTLEKRNLDISLIDLSPDIDYDKLNLDMSVKAKNAGDITSKINNLVLILKQYDNEKTKNEIISKGNELNLYTTVKSYNDDLNEFVNEIQPRIAYETVKDIIILIFCVIGLVGSVLALINDKKKELGVLISVGIKTSQLTLIYSLQYLILIILSYLSGILISFKVNKTLITSAFSNTFTFYNIGYPLLTLVVIFVFITTLTKIILKKIKPIELVGGFR